MGNTKSFNWMDSASGSYTSVKKSDSPSPIKKTSTGTFVLSEDPRSPTVAIPRTPIEIKPEDECSETPVRFKPSFSYNVETNAENCNPQDEGVEAKEDSAFIQGKVGPRTDKMRVPLRDASTPSLLLRYKQARKASTALGEQDNNPDSTPK